MIPLITGEIAFRQHVCELFVGVNIFDFDLWVLVDSVKQPIKRNSVGSGHGSHRRTFGFENHLDYSSLSSKM